MTLAARKRSGRLALFGALLLVAPWVARAQGAELQASYGTHGLERLTFAGETLLESGSDPANAIHIWHMRTSDLSGKVRSDGQYGWGETNRSRTWNDASHTWTYTFTWGSIRTQYVQRGDALDVRVTTTNAPESGVLFYGATIYPLGLHLAGQVSGVSISDGVSAPSVTLARSGDIEVAAVVPDARQEVWSGFEQHGSTLSPMVSSTLPDSLPGSRDRVERALKPGESETLMLSLRFAHGGMPVSVLAADALQSFAARWPAGTVWKDRRMIGTVFLASSPAGDKSVPAGFRSNPRRYFTDPTMDIQDLRTFQGRILQQADTIVTNLKRVDAQGMLTWDIEGEQYPQDTSYACAPDQIAQLAPEMETILQSGRYAGMKLDDAYFKIIHDAGFRVGVCVRPQHLQVSADRRARQVMLPQDQVAAELIRKMRFAHDRWGATLFYIDSTVDADGSTLPAEILDQAAKAMSDSLLIPEESTVRMYRNTAPFMSFLFHGETRTPDWVRAIYPNAFSVNLINDVDGTKLANHRAELLDAVRHGDIMLVHADSWHPNNEEVMRLYKAVAGSQQAR